MISIVVHQWRGSRGFLPEHVTTLARSIRRTFSLPHRFICVTDETGFGPEVEVLKTPPACRALAAIPSPEGARFPACYRRLWNFSREAACLGGRIFAIDIDLVVIKDLAPLFAMPDDFVGWRPHMRWGNHRRIGGGMYLLKAGSRADVYDRFKGDASIQEARKAGYRGSDQAWLSYCLGRSAAVWPKSAGLYSIRDMMNGRSPLPKDAIAVQFNGPQKPWSSPLPWVKEHWHG